MNFETAIDLSLRSNIPNEEKPPTSANSIVRPIPRPPWTIVWYQNLLPAFQQHQPQIAKGTSGSPFFKTSNSMFSNRASRSYQDVNTSEEYQLEKTALHKDNNQSLNIPTKTRPLAGDCEALNRDNSTSNTSLASSEKLGHTGNEESVKTEKHERRQLKIENISDSEDTSKSYAAVIDVACCDGPVHFERVSNPNFAVTVEHHNNNPAPSNEPMNPPETNVGSSNCSLTSDVCENRKTTRLKQAEAAIKHNCSSSVKTYLCIYCNQSFKSLFCYQKHKKRHLNPVSVDITGVHPSGPAVGSSENRVNKTKDLNVQFFPCKKCGCKFPSYYFVHKHKKICH